MAEVAAMNAEAQARGIGILRQTFKLRADHPIHQQARELSGGSASGEERNQSMDWFAPNAIMTEYGERPGAQRES